MYRNKLAGLAMLRVRFHGRGGHGIRTASRILGTAAFRAGWHAQDAPLYGAERRGAAVTASTRMDLQPILERGVIANPDLIVVADETLLADPEAGVLRGQTQARGVFVNSARLPSILASQYTISAPVVCLDLTSCAIAALGRAAALSSALGAVACALTGAADIERMAQAVQEELEPLHVTPDALEKNQNLARRVFGSLAPLPARNAASRAVENSIVIPRAEGIPRGVPIILASGNTEHRHTGSWRIFRPTIDLSACTRCTICLWRCPDGAVGIDDKGFPTIDYGTCKGCMVCATECPVKCIHEEREVQAW